MTKRHSARAVLLLSLSLPRAAWSQPAPAPAATAASSATQRETARTWLYEGRSLFDQQDYAAALERFTGAYQLVRAPTVGFELARAQEALGKWVEANATAVEVMHLPLAPDEPAVFAVARGRAKELLTRLTPLIPALRLDVTPGAATVRVEVDGESMPAPGRQLSFKLNPGAHELVISAPGYQTARRSLALREQERRTLAVALVADPSAATHVASVTTTATDSASAEPHDSATPSPTLGYVALSTAGVAALVGGVTGTLAFTTKPSCPSQHCFPEQRDDAKASRRYGNVATISVGLALVTGAYGLWEVLRAAPQRSAAPTTSAAARVLPLRSGALLEVSGALPF